MTQPQPRPPFTRRLPREVADRIRATAEPRPPRGRTAVPARRTLERPDC